MLWLSLCCLNAHDCLMFIPLCDNFPSPFVFECGMLHLAPNEGGPLKEWLNTNFPSDWSFFFFFFWSTQKQTRSNNPKSSSWQRPGKSFIHQGLNPGPFLSSPGPRINGLYQWAITIPGFWWCKWDCQKVWVKVPRVAVFFSLGVTQQRTWL
jgi:hypothetical protein